MKIHEASFLSAVVLVIAGILIWINFDASTKVFALGSNLLGAGLGLIILSLLIKFHK